MGACTGWPSGPVSPCDDSAELTLVVCGAPLASRTPHLVEILAGSGWRVGLVMSDAGANWTEAMSGPRSRRPNAVVVCPLSFNTVNKVAAGLMDTAATGVTPSAHSIPRPSSPAGSTTR